MNVFFLLPFVLMCFDSGSPIWEIIPDEILEENQRQYFRSPQIEGVEDEFCRRAYRIMLKGAYFGRDLYQEWPDQPGCGYMGWSGEGEKDMFANYGFAQLYAMLITFGEYDEKLAGISREEALRRVKGVIRYGCYNGIGNRSSWSTLFSHAVWLIWDELDEDTREMAARLIIQDADRFIGMEPGSGKIDNTRAESNAWSTRSMAIAISMFPDHPHVPQWREACSNWMMNVFSLREDEKDNTIVDGKPVHEWITTENIHPDFTLENHRIVYPVYMWTSMNGLALSGSHFITAGMELPEATFHHMEDVYEVYKRLQTWEGLPAYINGMDKFLHLQVVDINMHSFFAQVLKDPEAAHLEAVELDILERMQSRFDDGRLYHLEEVGPRSRTSNLGIQLGTSYLLHYLLQADVEPVSAVEFDQRISGVKYYPNGKFILHRTPGKLVSFAWSKPYRVMGLAMPHDGSWLVTPYIYGFTGKIVEEGKVADRIFEITQLEKGIRDDGFSVSAVALRCDGKIEQSWTFESTPGNDVIMKVKLKALRDIKLKSVETGSMGIGRELDSDAVHLKSPSGEQMVAGPSDPEIRSITFPEGEVTVDGRFTYHWTGSGSVVYKKRGYQRVMGGAPEGYGHYEDLLCVKLTSGDYSAGEIIAEGKLRVSMHGIPE